MNKIIRVLIPDSIELSNSEIRDALKLSSIFDNDDVQEYTNTKTRKIRVDDMTYNKLRTLSERHNRPMTKITACLTHKYVKSLPGSHERLNALIDEIENYGYTVDLKPKKGGSDIEKNIAETTSDQ